MKAAYFGIYPEADKEKNTKAVELAKRFCELKGYEYVGEYKDYTCERSNSEAFKKLVEDCDNGKVNFIIIKNLRALGVGTVHWFDVVKSLCEKGIGVYAVMDKLEITKFIGEIITK